MPTVVIPFAGAKGKTRLHASPDVRFALAQAMFRDVLAACVSFGRTRVVTPDEEAAEEALAAGGEVVPDPGRGQGAAVAAGLKGLEAGGILVVNADLPCLVPHDLRSLLAATPASGIALAEAADGTTNALSIPAPEAFAPLYGPGSAERFRQHAVAYGLEAVTVAVPNLAADVDTMEDLARVQVGAGPYTQTALAELARSVA